MTAPGPAPAGAAPDLPAIALLSAGNFVAGFGAFVAIGVLTPLAGDFALTPEAASLVITVYAVAYALGSPLLTSALGGLPRDRVVMLGVAAIGAGALVCAAASSFPLVLLGRVVIACGAGMVSPAAAAFVAATTAPAARGKFLSGVFFGFTLAQVAGVPAGAWLGYRFGWRAAFALCAALAAAVIVLMWLRLPRGVRVPAVSLATLGGVLADRRAMLAVSFTATFTGATYIIYTFMAPIVEGRFGAGGNAVAIALAACGIGGVVGNLISGRLVDRFGAHGALAVMCVVQAVCYPLVTLAPLGWAAFLALLFVWAAFGWAFYVPQQVRLVRLDPARAQVLLALTAAFLYVGIAVGSAVGAAVFRAWGLGATGIAAAIAGLAALAHLHASRVD